MRRSGSVRACPAWLSALSVFNSKSVSYGAFLWARRALISQDRRFPPRTVPVGAAGEIYVDTPGMAVQYLKDPAKTAERFPTVEVDGTPTRLYRTGDAGRILPSGELECLGRIDSTVKIRGYKVSIPFVESTIKEHAGVASAAVMPLRDEATGAVQSLAGYVVGTAGKLTDGELSALIADLQPKLPAYALPQVRVMTASLAPPYSLLNIRRAVRSALGGDGPPADDGRGGAQAGPRGAAAGRQASARVAAARRGKRHARGLPARGGHHGVHGAAVPDHGDLDDRQFLHRPRWALPARRAAQRRHV